MPRTSPRKVVAASDLLTGKPVYRTAGDSWSHNFDEAEVLTSAALADLRLLQADADAHIVFGACLADAAPAP